MSRWNHRVVRQDDAAWGEFYAVHEAYYADDVPPEGQPHSISSEPVAPFGETLDELRAEVEMFRRALDLPVLNYDDF